MKETARRLLKQMDNPDDPELRRLQSDAKEHVEEVAHAAGLFPDKHAIRRLSYTYYYDWETDDPDFMLLLQDPGNLHKRHLEELQPENPLEGGCTRREQVHIYRQFAKSWLTGRNADFSEQFFGTFDDHGLINLGAGWKDYITTERMFQDVYLGDVVKYRVDGFGRSAERKSYAKFLEEEIEALDPDLLITFGSNAWDALRRETGPSAVRNSAASPGKMLDIHGTLHSISDPIDTFVLPLSHMSGQVWWRFPPSDYIGRLDSALQLWGEVR